MSIPDGIYLGLDHQTYIDDDALGAHDLLECLLDPCNWHANHRNPLWRELNPPSEKESAATAFGTALHCMALEPDEFDNRYLVEPERPALPKTKEDINAALAEIGRPTLKSGDKKELYESAARMAGIKLASDWEAEMAAICAGRERISPQWDIALRMLGRVIERHSHARKFLSNGRSEVSVFWTDATGLRLKCRFDYLRIRTCADVKSYARRKGMTPMEAFASAMRTFAYDFQAAHYMDCRVNVMPGLIEEDRLWRVVAPVQGFIETDDGLTLGIPMEADTKFFEDLADWEKPSWHWLACMTMGVPQVDCVEFPQDILAFAAAQTQVDLAKQRYRDFREKFGADDAEMWIDDRGLIKVSDAMFTSYSTNRGADLFESDNT